MIVHGTRMNMLMGHIDGTVLGKAIGLVDRFIEGLVVGKALCSNSEEQRHGDSDGKVNGK